MTGAMPLRPNHPDFWNLATIVTTMDQLMEDAKTDEDKEIQHTAIAAALIDIDSLAYMAFQRAMRAVKVTTVGGVAKHRDEIMRLSAVYYEAVLVGIMFAGKSPGDAA